MRAELEVSWGTAGGRGRAADAPRPLARLRAQPRRRQLLRPCQQQWQQPLRAEREGERGKGLLGLGERAEERSLRARSDRGREGGKAGALSLSGASKGQSVGPSVHPIAEMKVKP